MITEVTINGEKQDTKTIEITIPVKGSYSTVLCVAAGNANDDEYLMLTALDELNFRGNDEFEFEYDEERCDEFRHEEVKL